MKQTKGSVVQINNNCISQFIFRFKLHESEKKRKKNVKRISKCNFKKNTQISPGKWCKNRESLYTSFERRNKNCTHYKKKVIQWRCCTKVNFICFACIFLNFLFSRFIYLFIQIFSFSRMRYVFAHCTRDLCISIYYIFGFADVHHNVVGRAVAMH